MIDQAVRDMNIDVKQSFIVGDRTVDVMTGINANLSTVLISRVYGGTDKKYDCIPNYEFDDLMEAANFIIKKDK